MTSRRQQRAGTDRWLVSYADFTTLLLAFFMALYAVSDVNPGKLATAASSLREAFDTPPIHEGTGVLPGSPVVRGPRSLDPGAPVVRGSSDPANPMARVRAQIEKELAGAITAGQLEIGADDRGLVLSLPESATFPVASADVTATAQAVIDRVAVTLAPLDVGVRIEGHTDDTGPEDVNQRLSEQRANSVRGYLINKGVSPKRLTAKGYGESKPLVDGTSDSDRAKNRRVQFVVDSADSPK